MRSRKLYFALGLVVAFGSGPLWAQSDQGSSAREFGLGQPATIGELPPGQFKRKLLELPPQSRGKALKWLQEFSFPEADVASLDVDGAGNILYVDTLVVSDAEGGAGAAPAGSTAEAAPATTLDDAFLLHSRPGAPNRVFLDFDGHTFSNTAWGSGTFQGKPYDLDGNPGSFNATERGRIIDIWHRVAEDLAPFDIDVTTEQPASFDRYTGRVLITHTVDQTGKDMPSNGGGGVAYVNVFGRTDYHTWYSPALVYYDHLGNGGQTYVAEASSHEFGHNLGLSHDGANPSTQYYAGHGSGLVSWAPIMGNSYYNNITEWSIGEYANANNSQDDLAIIDGKLGYKGDDHGDTAASSTALFVAGDGSVVSSNPEFDPHDELPENKGVIDDRFDVDVFSFIAGAGTVALTVTPAWDAFYRASDKRGANLDVRAELRNAAGSLLAASDPAGDTMASIDTSVGGGALYLHVSGVGNVSTPYTDYASLGQYFINGSVPLGTVDSTAPTPDPMQFVGLLVASGTDTISMTAATATDEVSAVQYQFRCTAGGAGCVNSAWQSSTSYTATGLAADTKYTYTVAARDLSGNQTVASDPASATTDAPPPPPPYVNYTADADTPVAGSVSGTVTGTRADDDGSVQSITERESGGKPQNRYTYLEHRWHFSIGSGDMVSVVANAWMSGPNAEESFDLEYSVNGGGFQPLLNLFSTDENNLQSAVLPDAPSGSITLRVVDRVQQSGNRNANTVHVDHLYIQVGNPPSEPPDVAPSGLGAVAASSSAIDLGWTDNSSNETGFRLERSLNGASGWVLLELPAGTENYRDAGLAAATLYYYRLSAWNPNGSSDYATVEETTQLLSGQPDLSLSATGYKVKGVQHVALEWSGSETVDVYRGGLKIAPGANGGSYDDDIGGKGGGTYEHRVCEVDTTNCSNTTTTVF